jgi:hypothetical protein
MIYYPKFITVNIKFILNHKPALYIMNIPRGAVHLLLLLGTTKGGS